MRTAGPAACHAHGSLHAAALQAELVSVAVDREIILTEVFNDVCGALDAETQGKQLSARRHSVACPWQLLHFSSQLEHSVSWQCTRWRLSNLLAHCANSCCYVSNEDAHGPQMVPDNVRRAHLDVCAYAVTSGTSAEGFRSADCLGSRGFEFFYEVLAPFYAQVRNVISA